VLLFNGNRVLLFWTALDSMVLENMFCFISIFKKKCSQIYGSLLRIFVGFSKDRRLSTREKQVRAICQTRLHQHIKENAAYWKQRGYQKAIRDGDANTAFHHAHATQRSRSNHISKVTVGEQELYSHESKMAALTNHVRSIMGQTGTSTWSFDVNELYDGRPSASDNLTAPFSEKEAVAVVRSQPSMAFSPGASNGHATGVPIGQCRFGTNKQSIYGSVAQKIGMHDC
jgi:hypothetical protein